ncbi:DNA repair metallo-beta-lactamase protein, putative [Plasmodium sp. gorilla clade G2]|uniref:DNA repair metallo-beta-lactamase protein, putative n=1 Tax=Plasmodium sp. gorilla clade G2 TaxID=880535 RepID=UPI000D201545|nr:DNA repair metallo-beta-lactamase protein, putative [Plasmodium sp. gorilla clade G2]SOV19957.1 DNA repair metallo-beta-lactamase protein, putative [Plasmodium sp. gorilla clade G2]
MVEDNIHEIKNDPLIIIDKFPYTKKREALRISEDQEKRKICRIFFLTHFHADHYTNINKYFNENVFCSQITKKLLVNIIEVNDKYVHNLKINKIYYLFNFKVAFIDANHCPGSVIIYFEFKNGTKIIHTGDFRYSNVHSFLIKKLLSYSEDISLCTYKKNEMNIKGEQHDIDRESINDDTYKEEKKIDINGRNIIDSKVDLNWDIIKKEKEENQSESINNDEVKEYDNNPIEIKQKKENSYIPFLRTNEKDNIFYMNENIPIYESDNYFVNLEEIINIYLKIVEELLLNIHKIEKKQFYMYDTIKVDNYFNHFLFIDLCLYFNQNEEDISFFFDYKNLNETGIILNNENIHKIHVKKNETFKCDTIVNDRESVKTEEKQINSIDQIIYDKYNNLEKNLLHIKIKEEKKMMPDSNCILDESQNNIQEKNKKKKKKRNHEDFKEFEDIQTDDKINENRNEIISENKNYIKTIYLDTTYALSKNNLFAPQMYLINYVIYLCKKRLLYDEERSSNILETNKISIEEKQEKKGRNIKKKQTVKVKMENNNNNNNNNICDDDNIFINDYHASNIKQNVLDIKNIINNDTNNCNIHICDNVNTSDLLTNQNEFNKEEKKKKKTLFLFGTYNLGKEKIYLSVSDACNMKIYYKNEKKRKIIESFLHNKHILNKITENKLEAQIHIVDINYSYIFPKLDRRKFLNLIDEDIEKEFDSFYYIIPTGWVKKFSFYERNNISIFLIPYSEHSNLDELKNFVKSIKPCNILPTVFYNEKEKTTILNIFNPFLNLKKELLSFFKMDKKYGSKNNEISPDKKKIKVCEKEDIPKDDVLKNIKQKKLTSFFPLIKKANSSNI